jgi:ComF family protein
MSLALKASPVRYGSILRPSQVTGVGTNMRISEIFRQVVSTATDSLFPARCLHCNRDGELLCDPCLAEAIRLTSDGSCRMCALPTHGKTLCGSGSSDPPPVSSLVAAFAFDGAIRSAVHSLKFEGLRAISPILSEEMASRWGGRRRTPNVVVPIPLHRSRLRSRGYNQAELLAGPVATRLEVPLRTDLLGRVVDSPSQAEAKDETERARRVPGIFAADAGVTGQHILLIDDVTTTRSTINSAASALLDAGAWGVSALVLEREL